MNKVVTYFKIVVHESNALWVNYMMFSYIALMWLHYLVVIGLPRTLDKVAIV